MKLIKTTVAGALVLTLMACGGGGGGGGDSASPAVTAATVAASTEAASGPTEFLGTWHSTDLECHHGWVYAANTWAKQGDTVITNTTVESSLIVYTDATCTSKAGKFTEKYTVTYAQGSIAGKTNVQRANSVYAGFTIGADGGSGLTLNKVPNNVDVKILLDVDGDKLYRSDKSSVLDADGYPMVMSVTPAWIR